MFKVVVVDDEPMMIHGLCRQIDWESFCIELAGTATNGQDALTIIDRNQVQLLITDVCMPHMDGLALIAKAKLINPSLRCIIISAYNEFEYAKKALQLGVENYLLKPINQRELNDTLLKTLENLKLDQIADSPNPNDVSEFRSNILNRWVSGSIQDYELYERAELLNINLSASEYMVCLLDVVNAGTTDQRFKYASLLLDISRRVISLSIGGECFLDTSFRVVIILNAESMKLIQEEIVLALKKINEQATHNGVKIFTSTSPISRTYASVSASYSSAVFYLNYRFINTSVTVFFFENYWSGLVYGIQDEAQTILMQLDNELKQENLKNAQLLAQKCMEMHWDEPFPKMRNGILPFVLSLIHIIIESGRATDALPDTIISKFSDFAEIESSGSLKDWLFETLKDSIQVIHKRRGLLHLLVRRTLEQVNQKYYMDISLKTLATSLKVSPSYLGQLFKEETGKYFNDYLTQVRLQASIDLLLETDMKINDIINRIGIPNQSYYNRIFKKYYGISPIAFRQQFVRQLNSNKVSYNKY